MQKNTQKRQTRHKYRIANKRKFFSSLIFVVIVFVSFVSFKNGFSVGKGHNTNNLTTSVQTQKENLEVQKVSIADLIDDTYELVNKSTVPATVDAPLITVKEVNNTALDATKNSITSRSGNTISRGGNTALRKSHSTFNDSTISGKERDLLERLVEAEAGGEPYSGKLAVANVVLNRVKSDEFPNTIRAVIYDDGQFAPVSSGVIFDKEPSDDCKKAVSQVYDSGYRVFGPDILYFCNEKTSQSSWIIRSKKRAMVIGRHSFFFG